MTPGEKTLQRRIGLTGGIASGKSSVGRWLEQQGVPVLDADVYSHRALADGTEASRTVLSRYGAKVASSTTDGIDRAALGRIVFNDRSERKWLEELVHPLVEQALSSELSDHSEEPVVVLMIPLLFETGLERLCSETWVVSCSPKQQLARLMQRDGLSEPEAQSRISAQMPLKRKEQMADHVINNDQTHDELLQALEKLKLESNI